MKYQVGDEVRIRVADTTLTDSTFVINDILCEDNGWHYIVTEWHNGVEYPLIFWSVSDLDENAELTPASKIRKMFEL